MTTKERTKLALQGLGNKPSAGKRMVIHRDEWEALRECVQLAECWDGLREISIAVGWPGILEEMRKLERSKRAETPAPLWRDELGVRRGR